MKRVGISLLITLFSLSMSAQVNTDSSVQYLPRYMNNVFVEGGGSFWYSVGYERLLYRFKDSNFSLYTNHDFGYYPGNVLHSDFGLGVAYGKRHQLDLEISGLTYWNLEQPLSELPMQLEYKRNRQHYVLPVEGFSSVGIGYRVTILRRLLLRAKPLFIFKYDFVFERVTEKRFWFSVAIGYQFGKK